MYSPEDIILAKYADVLVKFALGSGSGIKPGEVVQVMIPDIASSFLPHLQRSIITSGGHFIPRLIPTGLDRQFYELANEAQLTFFPKRYIKSKVDLIDHSIGILAEHDLHELKGVDTAKIMLSAESKKKAREWLFAKEDKGLFTWTLALYGTPAMAKEAGLSLKDYWDQIVAACFLDKKDPIGEWQQVSAEVDRLKKRLTSLQISKLHIQADATDLWLTMGENRQWLGGGGRNIPSFEVFTTPDWRGTNGTISFNQPLYRYGNIITNIKLTFKNGKVSEASADQNQKLLEQMIARPNADKVGEFSLTDSRLSRITKFMANTLYDENIGGQYGNTHLAVGMAYKDAFNGDITKLNKSDFKRLGFNDSGEHCDIMATTNRVVTAILKDGSKKVIYKDGKFTI